MSGEHRGPMVPPEQAGWPKRSKDTCDMCSASKVKCDKKRPICSRCDRLDYPCFYSPARRIRKHRLDDHSPTPSAGQQQQQQQQQQTYLGPPSTNVNGDESLSTSSSASDDFAFGRDSNVPHSLSVHSIFSPAFSMPDTNFPSLTTINREITSTKRRRRSTPKPSIPECQQSPISSDPKKDCATTAIDLLQKLDRTSLKSLYTSTWSNAIVTASLEAVIKEASVAIRRTSIILVCPCSRKPDIGLLAAGVCSALLDVYQTFLSANAAENISDHHPASARNGHRSTASRFSERTTDDAIIDSSHGGASPPQYSGVQAKAPIMRILGELARIADLVTQFRNRYSEEDEEDEESSSRDLLRALVASMTSRLKIMIDDFTHLLVDF